MIIMKQCESVLTESIMLLLIVLVLPDMSFSLLYITQKITRNT